jgi:hypothetical protein
MRTKQKIERWVEKRGGSIAIGHPREWLKSGQKFSQWYNETKEPKRAYSYSLSMPDIYQGAWVESGEIFTSLKDLFESIKYNI